MALTRFELGDNADVHLRVVLRSAQRASPTRDVPTGRYELPRRSGEAHFYRLSHPLAEALLPGRSRDRCRTIRARTADRLLKPCRQDLRARAAARGAGGLLRLDCLHRRDAWSGRGPPDLLTVRHRRWHCCPCGCGSAAVLTISGAVDRAKGQLPLDAHAALAILRARLADVAREQEAAVRRGVSERSGERVRGRGRETGWLGRRPEAGAGARD